MIPLTDEENKSCLKQEICHICKKEFINGIENSSEDMFIKYRRVRDHSHYTGNYRGAAHNIGLAMINALIVDLVLIKFLSKRVN